MCPPTAGPPVDDLPAPGASTADPLLTTAGPDNGRPAPSSCPAPIGARGEDPQAEHAEPASGHAAGDGPG